MKLKILIYWLIPLFTFSLTAQTPNGFSYQSILRNASGNALNNQAINVRISLLEGSASGTAFYTEIHTLITNVNGLINLVIGQGSNPSSDFSTIEWGKLPFYLKVETAPNGDDNYTLSTTSQLMSVPYAMHAHKVTVLENATKGDLFYFDGNKITKLPIGTNGHTLTVKNGLPVWDNTKFHVDPSGTFLDERDGQVYKWVKIGNQIWMAENLKAEKYTNGDLLSYIADPNEWFTLDNMNPEKAYCYYNNNTYYRDNYGLMYTFTAAANGLTIDQNGYLQGICPSGWHLPNTEEWTELYDYLGTNGYLGYEIGAMKSTSGWNNDNNGTDAYGFSVLPGGRRTIYNQVCEDIRIGESTIFWSYLNLSDARKGYTFGIYLNSQMLEFSFIGHSAGCYVRCIKD